MAVKADKAVRLGPFMKLARPEMIEAVALAGFDFALVDMEHGPTGQSELYAVVMAAERRNLPLIVRVPVREEPYIKWCLDLGVRHIQVPSVETAEDVAFWAKRGIGLIEYGSDLNIFMAGAAWLRREAKLPE